MDELPERTPTQALKSLAGLLGSMLCGFVVGWGLCILLGPQGIAGIAIACTFVAIGASLWWTREKAARVGCSVAGLLLIGGFLQLAAIRSTIGL